MNPITYVINEIQRLVPLDATLNAVLDTTNDLWLDTGLPNTQCLPCVRLDGLVCLDDKLNRYLINIKFYSQDTSFRFYETAEAMRTMLSASEAFYVSGYVDRPEADLSCVLFPCMFAVW